jgi:hypothetical protein
MKKPTLKEQCTLMCLTHQRQCVAEENHANACLCSNAVHTPEVQRKQKTGVIWTPAVI